ncbi:MAG: protein-export chaperone SecB [Betaproteobacteria bacterium]|nr:protein-export chaperone SecB [Betaproteobacteria bacterium]
MSEPQQAAPTPEQNTAPVFGIEKLYVKDLSVEVPKAPEIFLERETPEVGIQFTTRGRQLDNAHIEVELVVTVNATIGEKTVFLVEANQAGVFRASNIPAEDVEPLMGIACPNILFPFVREVISDTVIRAGFAPVILQPINFEAIYRARLQEAQANAEAQPQQLQ